jgi:hypothetical protein
MEPFFVGPNGWDWNKNAKNFPLKRGDIITIVKGTTIRSNGENYTAGRTYKTKVYRVSGGYINNWHHDEAIINPIVIWTGRNGWCETDLNNIPEVQKIVKFIKVLR